MADEVAYFLLSVVFLRHEKKTPVHQLAKKIKLSQ